MKQGKKLTTRSKERNQSGQAVLVETYQPKTHLAVAAGSDIEDFHTHIYAYSLQGPTHSDSSLSVRVGAKPGSASLSRRRGPQSL